MSSCPDDDNDSSRGGDETVASHAEAAARPRLAACISNRRSVHRPERVKETFGLTSCTIADCLALEDVTTALGTGALRDHERGRNLEVEPPEAQVLPKRDVLANDSSPRTGAAATVTSPA